MLLPKETKDNVVCVFALVGFLAIRVEILPDDQVCYNIYDANNTIVTHGKDHERKIWKSVQ
jgi:hypothetical protein